MSSTNTEHLSLVGGKGPLVLGISWGLTATSILAVGLRAYAASHINGKWRWDFIWAVLCIVFGVAAAIMLNLAVNQGLGNYLDVLLKLGIDHVWGTIHWLWISIFLGLVATTFAKYSMIALMLQVQGPSATKRRIGLYALGFLFTSVNAIQIALSYQQCRPLDKLWNRLLPGQCNGGGLASDWSIFQGSVGAFADFVLAIWPISIAWNLQTTRRVKIMFCMLMGVGMLPAIVSGYRVTHIPAPSTSKDITLDFGDFMIYCVVEFYAIVILTSIPVLRPLFLRVFYGIKTTASRSGMTSKFSEVRGTGAQNTMQGTRSKMGASSRVMDVTKDGSQDNVLDRDHVAMNIMVQQAYSVSEDIERNPSQSSRHEF